MKKINLNIGSAVEIKIDGGVDSGILSDKGIYMASVDLVDGDGNTNTVKVPYKDVLSQDADAAIAPADAE